MIKTNSPRLLGLTLYVLVIASSGFAQQAENSKLPKLSTGDTIPAEAFVLDKNLQPKTVRDLCSREPKAKVTVLYIYGGRVPKADDRLGGIWCPDSFEDLHILRYLQLKYQPEDLRIVPVACPPIYSGHNYGFENRVFLDQADDSTKFKEAVKTFIDQTEKLFVESILPMPSYYDIRHRLLFNRRGDLKPGAGYGVVHEWQGAFRSHGDTQRYGTPTIWLLDANGKVLAEPFWGNYYHSEPFQIRYTIVDLDNAIKQYLQ
jgi:hypothetical protein